MEGTDGCEALGAERGGGCRRPGCLKDAIYDAVRCHELPAIRIRRRILIPLVALEQLLANKEAR
jgi:hypothetical protein